MFYQFFILWIIMALTAADDSVQCQQKDVPIDILSSFNNSVPNLETGTNSYT